MLTIHELPISYYVDRLSCNDYFSLAGYSDAEWFSILSYDIGKATGLGQILTKEVGERLLDVLVRRQNDERFMVATPKCMWELPDFQTARIGSLIQKKLKRNKIKLEFCERDMITDDLAKDAGLHPLIRQLQAMSVTIIGNQWLRGLDFLGYRNFIEISSPNLHMEENGIENAAQQAIDYGQPGVYLVSAGMSAALIIDLLHDAIPDAFFIDCGSIWDAFVGIGAQRAWRQELYSNPEALERWRLDNLYGKP